MGTNCSSTTQEEVGLKPLQPTRTEFVDVLSNCVLRSDPEARHVQWSHPYRDFSQPV